MRLVASLKQLLGSASGAMRSIRLIACDIDGTLLNDDGDIYDSTVDLIAQLAELDVEFILSTGRTHHTAFEVYELLGVNNACIAYDGAVIAKSDSSAPKVHYIEKQSRDLIEEHCTRVDLSLTAIDANSYTTYGQPYSPDHLQHENIDLISVDRLADVFTHPAFRYYGVGPRASVEFVEQTVRAADSSLVVHSRDSRRLVGSSILEIRLRDCDKGTGLRRYLESTSYVPSAVAVIGDYRNDLPMFQKDYYCVALANAVTELKEKADFITKADSQGAGIDEFLSAVHRARLDTL